MKRYHFKIMGEYYTVMELVGGALGVLAALVILYGLVFALSIMGR